jgi:putative membrane protein
MTVLLWVSAIVAGLAHLLFFCEESLFFMRPGVHQRTFGLSLEQARTVRLFAFNQGFYNLFLAGGAFAGLAALALGREAEGRVLLAFACGSMMAAAVVLVASKRAFWAGALVQGVPPALALAALAVR